MSISGKVDPVVRPVAATDIAESLIEGLRDFQALPLYGVVFGALYAAGGITIAVAVGIGDVGNALLPLERYRAFARLAPQRGG